MKFMALMFVLTGATLVGAAVTHDPSVDAIDPSATLPNAERASRPPSAGGLRPESYAAVVPRTGPSAPVATPAPDAFQAGAVGAPMIDPAGAPSAVAVTGTSRIPYPLYPNGHQYRIGGEHGLKIVAYQTDDAFADVDAYYRNTVANRDAMQRLEAMRDYVRYSLTGSDDDPWETSRPGIVIHELTNDAERRAVGAGSSARTNIIISF